VDIDYRSHVLGRSTLLAQLGQETWREIALSAREQVYGADQIIINAGEPSEAVYLVVRGKVQTCRLSITGREYVLNDYGPGQVFNLASVLDGGVNLATATATTESTVYAIPHLTFHEIASKNHAMMAAILRHMADQVHELTDAVTSLALCTVRARLARFLLDGAHDHPETVPYWTQDEIAMRIGTVRDVVGRTLRAFAREGLIKRDRERLTVTDATGLRREAMYGTN
jgi:CRP/FNR family cyclic AMP-dependent transcriptional regulator